MTQPSNEIDKLLTLLQCPSSPLVEIINTFSRKSSESDNRSTQPIHIETFGSWGSLPRLLAAVLNHTLTRPVLFITAHIPDAYQAQDDLETFSQKTSTFFPAAESWHTQIDPTSEIACQRLRLCQLLCEDQSQNALLIAPIQALTQPVPNTEFLTEHILELNTAASKNPQGPQALAQWLVDQGFNHVDRVDATGDFAARGGIIDIYAPDQDLPVRIEFFGDDIESIRFFDLDTQRSIRDVCHITLTGCTLPAQQNETTSFIHLLPPQTLIILEESADVLEMGKIFHDRVEKPDSLLPIESIFDQINNFDTLSINHFKTDHSELSFPLNAQSVQRFENHSHKALSELLDSTKTDNIYYFCENPAEKQRTLEIIKNDHPKITFPDNLHFPIGYVHRGFSLPEINLTCVTHHEIFGQFQPPRRIRKIKTSQPIDTFHDLEINDYIVHVNYGIGRFKGLKTLTKNDRDQEFLAIEYAEKALIHVPADKIQLIHKYVGAHTGTTKLSRLGSKRWQNQKQKVSDAVIDLAAELIETQAIRDASPGITYPADTQWQQEFEQLFPYQPTEDQININHEIKNDMQRSRPMDRLLCGDVGYGKTELAVRAAFKAVEFGKQVALLVPTTVLAEQHYRTFKQRLADFPFNVDALSRFKTPKQAKQIIERAKKGQIDILIGTHRLLSPDVTFKDLGLVIIDEEQRFGVEHKEKLKTMRQTVDLLTMTATPIPRTLHMAFLGIRDISSLTTPPLDRRSIATEVCTYNKHLIRQTILRELARDGQVYFLHNRVHSILTTADTIQKLVPEARIIVAHGQMPRHELEQRMVEFVLHQADVLVCTTIIESGLDIPNANTIIINDADRFGLAELHQLRGRVGRYKNRAYAYMLLPQKRPITPIAAKRLKAIEEYSQLGAGFRIAMRDLEIRGAGNILGVEQSGHIDAVGYELYCRLLSSAVKKLKNQPETLPPTTHLELVIDTSIPRSYITSDRQRIDAYRRLATCSTTEELDQLEKDLIDQFGKFPAPVQNLLQLAEIRILASNHQITSIIQDPPDLIFASDKMAKIDPLFKTAPGSVRIIDNQTLYWRPPKNYIDSPATLLAILRKLLASPK